MKIIPLSLKYFSYFSRFDRGQAHKRLENYSWAQGSGSQSISTKKGTSLLSDSLSQWRPVLRVLAKSNP